MRFDVTVIIVIVAALVVDAVYFQSRYSSAAATMFLEIARRMLPG